MEQSIRWKRAAEAEGFSSAGTWLAAAADAYLKVRARAGAPVPLAWRLGRLSVTLEGGEMVSVWGYVSPPFGAFRGTSEGPTTRGSYKFSLVYLPTARILATMRHYRDCKAVAADIARSWARVGAPVPPLS
jgi:hypothetical protein